jgi:D-inositol-3-phosphate glycosyltransferase
MVKKLNVAMISYHTCPLATLGGKDTGGMNVYVHELTRQLGHRGIHVDVFTRSQDEHVPHVVHDLGYGNPVVHVPAGPEVPLPKEQLIRYFPNFIAGVMEYAHKKNIQYDVIHSNYWMSGVIASELKSLWDIPVVHMFHTLGLMKQRVARIPGEAEGDYRTNGERQVLQMADRIVAATQAELAQLQWLYQADTRKVVIIPPGVDLGRFYPIPKDEAKNYLGVPVCDRTLLFVGRIEPLKGVDTLIEAIATLRRQEIYTCLTVIGGDPQVDPEKDDPEMARLKSILADYTRRDPCLGDLVTFLGKRSQDTLPYYYSAAEAVVMPSHYESFGMVALEAMACGTPVVASDVGGLAFLVQDGKTGFTVPAGDSQALADSLRILLEDTELKNKMGRQAAASAKAYSWERIAARIDKVYQELTAQPEGDSYSKMV